MGELYVPERVARRAILLAEETRILVARAFTGETFSKLLNKKNLAASIANDTDTATVPLGTFDRRKPDERRVESIYRRLLLRGALSLVSDDFVFNEELFVKPIDISSLAEVVTEEPSRRSISVTRLMVSVENVENLDEVRQDKLLYGDSLPGEVTYLMFVQNLDPVIPSE